MKQTIHSLGRKSIQRLFSYRLVRESLRKHTKTGRIPRSLWGKFPVNTDFRVDFPHGIELSYVSSLYDGIGRQLYWRGAQEWEYETIEVFCRLAKHARRVLDIGANTGTYALIACAAHPETTVMAFEPVPRIYAQFVQSLKHNGFEGRCTVEQAAVSDSQGTAQFNVPNQGLPTVSSLHPEGFRGMSGTLIEVPVVTIDGLLAEDDKIDLIKIDVEGFECEVLRGGMSALAECRPTILMEFDSSRHENLRSDFRDLFCQLKYDVLRLSHGGCEFVATPWNFEGDLAFRNVLCVPN